MRRDVKEKALGEEIIEQRDDVFYLSKTRCCIRRSMCGIWCCGERSSGSGWSACDRRWISSSGGNRTGTESRN